MERFLNRPRIFFTLKTGIFFCLLLCLLVSCSKPAIDIPLAGNEIPEASAPFIQYTIAKGEHSSDKSSVRPVNYQIQKFVVKFDSSAIYQTAIKANQYDINKLYGFADNDTHHHEYSARFGWRWNQNALRLFAYVYNAGVRAEKELGVVAIGAEHNCAIQVIDSTYIFTLNGKSTSMQRASTTPTGIGYKLYPYFGGDETAPHEVRIWVKEF